MVLCYLNYKIGYFLYVRFGKIHKIHYWPKVTYSNQWQPKYKHIKLRLRTGQAIRQSAHLALKFAKSRYVKHDIIFAF